MNPIEFMKANGLDPEDYKAVPTVALQDKKPVIARRRGTVKLVKQRRSRYQIGDVRKLITIIGATVLLICKRQNVKLQHLHCLIF